MTPLDYFLILILFGFVWFGFWFGFIHTLGALIGTIAGAWLAGRLYIPAYEAIGQWLSIEGDWMKFVIFVAIFFIINRLIGFAFYLLDRTFHIFTIIPFLKSINRLGGAVFGALEGALALGLVLYFAGTFNLPTSILQAIANSELAQTLILIAGFLVPLLPEILTKT
ncbi:MAG: Colicin V production protein [Parcubacteria group bacterium GW2011_GWA2_46_39]|nr:MAG: Colicin V production protein [Parcubacteria group bacterium GW2011_GWA2_46_39]